MKTKIVFLSFLVLIVAALAGGCANGNSSAAGSNFLPRLAM